MGQRRVEEQPCNTCWPSVFLNLCPSLAALGARFPGEAWVRPYYVECTTSRQICEVKQRQAQLVLW